MDLILKFLSIKYNIKTIFETFYLVVHLTLKYDVIVPALLLLECTRHFYSE